MARRRLFCLCWWANIKGYINSKLSLAWSYEVLIENGLSSLMLCHLRSPRMSWWDDTWTCGSIAFYILESFTKDSSFYKGGWIHLEVLAWSLFLFLGETRDEEHALRKLPASHGMGKYRQGCKHTKITEKEWLTHLFHQFEHHSPNMQVPWHPQGDVFQLLFNFMVNSDYKLPRSRCKVTGWQHCGTGRCL